MDLNLWNLRQYGIKIVIKSFRIRNNIPYTTETSQLESVLYQYSQCLILKIYTVKHNHFLWGKENLKFQSIDNENTSPELVILEQV